MTMTIEMFEFNSLSQFSIALFIYHDGQFCEATNAEPRPDNLKVKAKKFGLKASIVTSFDLQLRVVCLLDVTITDICLSHQPVIYCI